MLLAVEDPGATPISILGTDGHSGRTTDLPQACRIAIKEFDTSSGIRTYSGFGQVV